MLQRENQFEDLLVRGTKEEEFSERSIALQKNEFTYEWDDKYTTLGTDLRRTEEFRSALKDIRSSVEVRFMRTVCDLEHLALPNELLDPIVRTYMKHRGIELPLDAVLPQPHLLPEQVLEGLRLIDLSEYSGDRKARVATYGAPEFMNKLKAVIRSSEPVVEGQTRFFRVSGRDPLVENETIGTILYFRENPVKKDGGRYLRPNILSHFEGAYDVYRKTQHTSLRYRKELMFLTEMKVKLKELNRRLDKEWNEDKKRLLVEGRKLLSKYSNDLKECVSRHKVAAHEFFEAAADFTDRRGRVNVTATMSRIVPALDKIEQRFIDMRRTNRYNSEDASFFKQVILEHEKALREFRVSLEKSAPLLFEEEELFSLSADQDVLFSSDSIDRSEQSKRLLQKMRVNPEPYLKDITLRPFRTFASEINRSYLEFKEALDIGTQEHAYEAFLRLYGLTNFNTANVAIEHFRVAVGCHPEKTNSKRLLNFLSEEVEPFISNKSPFGGEYPDDLLPTFDEITETVTELKKILNSAMKRNPFGYLDNEVIEEIEGLLTSEEAFDIEESFLRAI